MATTASRPEVGSAANRLTDTVHRASHDVASGVEAQHTRELAARIGVYHIVQLRTTIDAGTRRARATIRVTNVEVYNPHSIIASHIIARHCMALRKEIVDAKWFHCDDMPTRFPGNISISQWLIDDFLRRRRGIEPAD